LERVPELDFVIRHEPELTFAELLERIANVRSSDDLLGIALRDDAGKVVVAPDRPLVKRLDDLPIPKQHLLPLDRYRMPFLGKRYTWVLTNRGCPFSCTYCFEGVVWGKYVRYRSAESIYQELEYLAEHDVRNILFLADLFTYDRKGVMRLCDLIIENDLQVRWTCNSRVDTIDEEMIVKMKRAGCWLVAFGIESGSQAVLDNVKKDAKVSDAEDAVRLCNKHGLKTWGYFIIGLPGENKSTVQETINLAKRIPLDIALFHIAMPYAGTEFYFQAVANGWLNTNEWKHFDMNDSAVLEYDAFSAEQILKATKRAFREFYLRPIQIWRLLRMTLSARDVTLIWTIAKSFAGWLFTIRNDRVARREASSGARRCKGFGEVEHAESGSAREEGATVHVLEAPRTNLNTGKPRHQAVGQMAGSKQS
jgi:radical SAM superfamily enzyme YgiQ (UPF0313 family)